MKKKYFTFIGPIAAGKGTHSDIMCRKYGFLHLSIGQILRDAVEKKTELGMKVQNILDNGFLVPDELVNNLVQNLLSEIDLTKGFILDGFPRTVNQAKELDNILNMLGIKLDASVYLDINENEIMNRVAGRFVCSKCRQNYHKIYNPTKVAGVCDICGSTNFFTRNDDKQEIVKTRIERNRTEIAPIIKYYEEQGKLFKVDANEKTVEQVSVEIDKIVS